MGERYVRLRMYPLGCTSYGNEGLRRQHDGRAYGRALEQHILAEQFNKHDL
jgi:hypothetical protein